MDVKAEKILKHVFSELTTWSKKKGQEKEATLSELQPWFQKPEEKITKHCTYGEARKELGVRLLDWYENKWARWVHPLFIPPERLLLVSRKFPNDKEQELIADTTALWFSDIYFRGCTLTTVTPETSKEWNFSTNVPAGKQDIRSMKRANLDVRVMPDGALEFKLKVVIKLKDPNIDVIFQPLKACPNCGGILHEQEEHGLTSWTWDLCADCGWNDCAQRDHDRRCNCGREWEKCEDKELRENIEEGEAYREMGGSWEEDYWS